MGEFTPNHLIVYWMLTALVFQRARSFLLPHSGSTGVAIRPYHLHVKVPSLSIVQAQPSDEKDSEFSHPDGLALDEVASKLKMQVFDLDEGLYGIDSSDVNYGIEMVQVEVSCDPSLGLGLEEVRRGQGGRGLVLVKDLAPGGNAALSGKIRVGDTLCRAADPTVGARSVVSLEAVDLDGTLQNLGALSFASRQKQLVLIFKRLVKREMVNVKIALPDGGEKTLQMLSGSNLRGEMIRQGLPEYIYDPETKRYDQPFITGNCGGEGICGTCLIEVMDGPEMLSEADNLENMLLENQPIRWRLSCRTFVGPDNKSGSVKVRAVPQKEMRESRKK